MSQVFVQGKVMEVEMDVDIAKNGGGKYRGTRLIYRDSEGALKEQNIHSNALKYNPTLKQMIQQLKTGDTFTMLKEKEGEFWNVKSITNGGVHEAVPTKATVTSIGKGNDSPKSTYQTAEERAQTQVYIVRQSSITQAIALATLNKTTSATAGDIIKLAKQFEAHVFGNSFDDGSIESLETDIL